MFKERICKLFDLKDEDQYISSRTSLLPLLIFSTMIFLSKPSQYSLNNFF